MDLRGQFTSNSDNATHEQVHTAVRKNEKGGVSGGHYN